MEWSPPEVASSRLDSKAILQDFMKPEGSLPCSQQPIAGPCPEPNESSPHYQILFH
jgi:hypothetical protein